MSEIIERTCGYCKSKNSKKLYPTYDIFGSDYFIQKCNVCKAYFLAPRPDEKKLSQAYDDSYYGEKEDKFNPFIEKVINVFRYRRAKRITDNLPLGAKILDIGCGNGRFLKYLLNFGKFELYGTELEGNSAKRASEIPEINLKIGLLKHDDFEENYFDAISLFHVFEHLIEPKETLEIITKILKPKGTLTISFPNIDSWQAKIFKGKWLHLDPPRHLFFFKPKDFVLLAKTYGFQLEEKHFLSFEQNPFGWTQSILNCFYKKREVLFESLKGNKNYIKEFSRFNSLLQKLFFVFSFPLFAIFDIIESIFNKGATVEFRFKKI